MIVTRRSVVVIGAGIGGITAAAHLARAGLGVSVVERHATPGGRCSQLVRGGHRFDIGPTLLAASLTILAGSIVGALWIAARVYSAGVLLYGQRPSARRVLDLVRTGA